MKDLLTQLLTGKDGQTHDMGRWSWAISIVSVVAGGVWNALHAGALDLAAFSQAIGAVVLAHGGALFAKAKTEPEPKAPE
jgi:hypothetical protein